MVSAGGALARVRGADRAMIFKRFIELNLAFWGCCAMGVLGPGMSGACAGRRSGRRGRVMVCAGVPRLLAFGAAFGWHIPWSPAASRPDTNFYGILRVAASN